MVNIKLSNNVKGVRIMEQFILKDRSKNRTPLKIVVDDTGRSTEIVIRYEHSSIKLDLRDAEYLRSILDSTVEMNK